MHFTQTLPKSDKVTLFQLLYSHYSLACVINPQYSDSASFDQVFDIFSTQSHTSAQLIEYQFGQLGPQNTSHFAYDSQQLNDSASDILQSLNVTYPTAPGYLLAALRAYNATDSGGNSSNSGNTSASTASGSSGSPNTALAMFAFLILSKFFVCLIIHRIVLYAITGCVSALFCIVIISGVSFPTSISIFFTHL